GCNPVREVSLVGHADRDPARGRAFENEISRTRARELQRALAAAIRRVAGRPGAALAARLTWRIEGAGATQRLDRSPRSEPQRARNRRVDVFLLAPPVRRRRGSMPAPATALRELPTPPASRPCCILAPTISPFSSDGNLADPSRIGTHGGSDEVVGLIYT